MANDTELEVRGDTRTAEQIRDSLPDGGEFGLRTYLDDFLPDAPGYSPEAACLVRFDGGWVLSTFPRPSGDHPCHLFDVDGGSHEWISLQRARDLTGVTF